MTLAHSRALARATLAEVRSWGVHRQGGGSWPPSDPSLVNTLARVIRNAEEDHWNRDIARCKRWQERAEGRLNGSDQRDLRNLRG